MKVYIPDRTEPAPLLSLLAVVLETCAKAQLSDDATISAMVQLDALSREAHQRCATCFNWCDAGFIYPAVLDGVCHLVTMCSACMALCERDEVTPEMISRYHNYILGL